MAFPKIIQTDYYFRLNLRLVKKNIFLFSAVKTGSMSVFIWKHCLYLIQQLKAEFSASCTLQYKSMRRLSPIYYQNQNFVLLYLTIAGWGWEGRIKINQRGGKWPPNPTLNTLDLQRTASLIHSVQWINVDKWKCLLAVTVTNFPHFFTK